MAAQRSAKKGKENDMTATVGNDPETMVGRSAAEIGSFLESGDESSANDGKPKVAKGMRPLFNEVSRLSQTLGLVRQACYNDKPEIAVRALGRLQRQVPDALELADIINGSSQTTD